MDNKLIENENNIVFYTEEELDEKSVCSILKYTASDNLNYKYNLDMII